MTALLRLTCEEPPTLVAHSLLGTLAVRFAADHGERLRRLVIYAAPGVGPYRMPIGLRAVAIRFALRPSEANMVRFERWAFADLDRVRRQDPDWLDAFTAYTRSRALVPHVKRTMRQLVATGTKQVRERIDVPTTLLWGAQDRFVPLDLAHGKQTTRLAFKGDRRRRTRPAHRTAGRLRPRARGSHTNTELTAVLRNFPIPEANLAGIAAGFALEQVRPWRLHPVRRSVGWPIVAAGSMIIARSLKAAGSTELSRPRDS